MSSFSNILNFWDSNVAVAELFKEFRPSAPNFTSAHQSYLLERAQVIHPPSGQTGYRKGGCVCVCARVCAGRGAQVVHLFLNGHFY